MKLLIITQVVDRAHPTLGFFHRWIEEFAKHCESVEVIALQVGSHSFPQNVAVHSLGKEKGAGKLQRTMKFFSYMKKIHNDYDAVFVHMNPEYIVLAGWWWRVTGKKIGLWYTHKSVDTKLRIAEFFAHIIFTASRESFRLPSPKVQVMGHGIDTDFFSPNRTTVTRGAHLLSVGRLMKSKRHDLAIQRAKELNTPLRIAGEGTERGNLEALAERLGAEVVFLGPLNQQALRGEYQRAGTLIHRSETGSLDKVVLEAFACGCPVDTTDPALSKLPWSVEYVREHHSLHSLIPRLIASYEKP